MYYEYQDKLEFLVNEIEYSQYVCFSDYLPEEHPEFIIVVECDEVESIEELEENIFPDKRIIVKRSSTTDSELIYKIYLKKLGKLNKNEYSKETVEFIAEMMTMNDEANQYDIEDDDSEDGYIR